MDSEGIQKETVEETMERVGRKLVVYDDAPKETTKPKSFRHRYLPGQLLKSADGRAQYRVDETTGAFKRLNPTMSKKARRKAEQKARRKH